jgi:hypothetical protein
MISLNYYRSQYTAYWVSSKQEYNRNNRLGCEAIGIRVRASRCERTRGRCMTEVEAFFGLELAL